MRRPPQILAPLLAGARDRDRLLAAGGGALGLALVVLVSRFGVPAQGWPPLLASIGASAVLVFAVPASPLAQPWPVIGGNIVSALVGIAVVRLIPQPPLAAAVAVGGAILAMSLLRCLHPPGGGTALVPVIGGVAVEAAGYGFTLMPVALNAAVLVLAGWAFHRVSGHSYPHRPAAPATLPVLHPDDIDAALNDMGEAFDISREDLTVLLQHAERHALARRRR